MTREPWAFWQQVNSYGKQHLWIPYRNWDTMNYDFDLQPACGMVRRHDGPIPAQRAERCRHCEKTLTAVLDLTT